MRSVVETASDAIVLGDQNGNIILGGTRRRRRFFGYAAEEALGEPLTLIMPARYRASHQRGIERLRATGHPHIKNFLWALGGRKKGRLTAKGRSLTFCLYLTLCQHQTDTHSPEPHPAHP